ncbi:hypothetical protein [Thiobacillus sp.]|uniref:hypothetical protein n=1 Tax=Thiobacillus sp. TaxID=924 RepID=UPI00286DE495|nr:hypothetical protein [Thiobacillus sp.]
MEIEKWLPITISVLALSISLGSLYLQHFRRARKGRAAVLSSTWSRDVSGLVQFQTDIAFSNQGNRPFVVSRVWLLTKMKDGNKRRYESEMLNQQKPLKVPASSIEHMHLTFDVNSKEFLSDIGHVSGSTETTIDLIFYTTDDEGREHYSQTPIMDLIIPDDKICWGTTTIKSVVDVLDPGKPT